MKKRFHEFCGASARIIVHRNGTATLIVKVAGTRHKSEHKNYNAARAAWYRWCA